MTRAALLLLLLFVAAFCVTPSRAQQPATSDPPKTDSPDKEKDKPKGVIHLQEVKDVTPVHAKQNCPNFSWAAALEIVLAKQNVELKQGYWADKFYGGEICLDAIGSLEDLIRKAEGEYTLDDGRHIKIELQYFAGLPSNSAALLVPIMSDELQILFVDGTAEVLTGAMWDDYLSQRGERMIDLKELHLLNPLLEGDEQRVILDATGDDAAKISGFMKVTATEINVQYWPK